MIIIVSGYSPKTDQEYFFTNLVARKLWPTCESINMETAIEKTPSRIYNQFEDFNVGDKVRLKSGGPEMTVDNASSSRIQCVWFETREGSHICHRQEFDQGAIEKITPAEKPAA